MNNPETFFLGGLILTIIGIFGVVISAYFVATRPKKDENSTMKIIGLVLSIVLSLTGGGLLTYYYFKSDGTCALNELAQNIRNQEYISNLPSEMALPTAPAASASPAPYKTALQPPVNYNINVNHQPQKPV